MPWIVENTDSETFTAEKRGTEWVMHCAILPEVEVRNSSFLISGLLY